MKEKVKALGLLSGGLDSRLAVKLMLEQGVEVEVIHFKLPFEGCCFPDCAFKFSQLELIPLHMVDVTKGRLFMEYIRLIRKPKYGYGSGMNPCVDCRIFMLNVAKKIAKKIGAKFIFTGEVLNERPMSQTYKALKIIEREVGLEGKILRPLSARLLPKTEVEKEGLVDRSKLLAIRGRRRRRQLDLAEKFKLRNFPTPSGGCILCEKEFAAKLRDLLEHKKNIKPKDVELLKVGRHFRFNKSKIIVGRNEKENKMLIKLKQKTDYVFEVPGFGSPITILQGEKSRRAIRVAAKLTARYSDCKEEKVIVKYGKRKPTRSISVIPAKQKEVERWRIIFK